ncbi:cystatin-B [Larimichthys crocea]|uniref:cystatin-B n=1 Tax=Larimichthys crocea TaxID=215358 RepID=UPI0009018774|nr:cystatin-B [Larimichthys crocea]
MDTVTMPNMPEGWSDTKDATEEIQNLCKMVKSHAEDLTDKKYGVFKAVKYREQIVVGVNYILKVHIGRRKYIHLFVLQKLECYGGKVMLLGVEEYRKNNHPLEPF